MPGCFIGVILKDGIIYKVNEKSPHFLLLNEVKRLMIMEYNRLEWGDRELSKCRVYKSVQDSDTNIRYIQSGLTGVDRVEYYEYISSILNKYK